MQEKTQRKVPIDSDNLISFVFITCGDVDRDIRNLENCSTSIEPLFQFYELIYIITMPDENAVSQLREQLDSIASLRLLVFDIEADFDQLLIEGLAEAIGDYVVAVDAGEVGSEDVVRMVETCLLEGCDILRGVRPPGSKGVMAKAHAAVLRSVLSWIVGRRIEPLQCRAVCLSRRALAKLMESNSALRYFRLVDVHDVFNEQTLFIEAAKRSSGRSDTLRRVRLVAQLAALRAPQIATTVAILLTFASLLSALFGVYAALVWLFKEDVAEGWLSISLVLAFTATAVFGALAAISLGMAQILKAGELAARRGVMTEYSTADLFARSRRLNVEIRHDD